jgi:hypothetical protein
MTSNVVQPGKKQYQTPTVVTYGRMDKLTLGSAGSQLDFSFPGFNFIGNNGLCNPSQFVCFVTRS